MCFVLVLVPLCILWFSGTALLLCSVSRQCVAVFFFARLLSHYSLGFLCLSLLFDMRTVIFTLCATWWLFSRSVLLSQMYSCTVCVGSCLAGKVAVVMSWGGSVFATRFGRVLVGAGLDGLFMAGGVLVRHRKFYWWLFKWF